MTIPFIDLVTPTQSGVVPSMPGTTGAPGTWLAQEYANATTLNLQATSWQSGGIARTIMALVADLLAKQDTNVSLIAQGGFLDYAASGTVTYTALNGTTVTAYVTPDPTVPSQWPAAWNGVWQQGWLDQLGLDVYSTIRLGAARASLFELFVNTSGISSPTFQPGSFHISNAVGATYSNVGTMTLAANTVIGTSITGATNATPIVVATSTPHGRTTGGFVYQTGIGGNTNANGFFQITVIDATHYSLNGSSGNGAYTSGGLAYTVTQVLFQADIAGSSGSSGIGTVTNVVTATNGVSCYNAQPFVGTDFEGNQAYASRCRAKLATISPNGPKDAYRYFAVTSAQLLAAQTPPLALTSPITGAIATSAAGVVTTTIRNQTPASVVAGNAVVHGASQLAITAASNASPIVLQVGSTAAISTGDTGIVAGVQGNTAANGTFTLTVVDGTHVSLNGSTGNGAYTAGGTLESGDLGLVDSLIQANCVPDGITAKTQSASAWPIAITAVVNVPAQYVATYTAAVQAALSLYFLNLAIGGVVTVQGIQTVLPLRFDDIVTVIGAAGIVGGQPSYADVQSVTVNGGTVDIAFPVIYTTPAVAVLSPTPVITVNGT